MDHHQTTRIIGHWLVGSSILNFWIVETRWFAQVLGISLVRATWNVLVGLLEGATFLIAVGFLFTR